MPARNPSGFWLNATRRSNRSSAAPNRLSPAAAMLLWREKLPDSWLGKIRENLPAVLVDHAHLERKAATSALNLEKYVELHDQVSELNAIAIEELQHFDLVLQLLRERGVKFTVPQRS